MNTEEKDISEMDDAEFAQFIAELAEAEPEDTEPQLQVPPEGEENTAEGAKSDMEQPPEGAASIPTQENQAMVQQPPAQSEPDRDYLRVLEYAKRKYPDAADERAALSQMLDAYDSEEANAGGMSVEEYRRNLQEQREFDEWKSQRQRQQEQAGQAEQIVQQWQRDEQSLKELVPGFDLKEAFKNEQFKKLVVDQGKGIIAAYAALNKSNESKADKRPLDEVGANAYASAPGTSDTDMSKASDEDFRRYIKRIMNED